MGKSQSRAGKSPLGAHSGFTITSWNLLHGMAIPPNSGATLHGALEKLTSDLSSDVVAIQEVDVHQSRSGNGNQVKEIAELIGAKYWAFAPSMYGTPGEKWRGVTEEIVFDDSTPIPPDVWDWNRLKNSSKEMASNQSRKSSAWDATTYGWRKAPTANLCF
ncbi:MAG: hypothetical protein RLZZ92_527 [Actinomycetota bacterium]